MPLEPPETPHDVTSHPHLFLIILFSKTVLLYLNGGDCRGEERVLVSLVGYAPEGQSAGPQILRYQCCVSVLELIGCEVEEFVFGSPAQPLARPMTILWDPV